MRRTRRQTSSVSNSLDLNTAASPSDYARSIAARHISISSIARGAGIGLLFATVSATAANIVVNSADETLNSSDGVCTLRDAVFNANTPGVVSATPGECIAGDAGLDTVDLTGVAGTITLTSGEIAVTQPLTITGPGQGLLSISGNNASRIFNINADSATTISGLTLTNGQTPGTVSFEGRGGAIRSASNLTLESSTVKDSTTLSGQALGGGVFVSGNFTMNNSTVSGNSTQGGTAFGGGVHVRTGSAILTNSTVSRNSTQGAGSHGGGLHLYTGSTLTLTNSTVSGNTTSGNPARGAGIYATYGATIKNSTIAFNVADYGSDGLHFDTENGAVTIQNTIIAQSGAGEVACSAMPTSGTNNLVTDNSCGTASLVGIAATSVTALSLGPLQVNGGPTATHALGAGSAAIDNGSGGVCLDADVKNKDQRGVVRIGTACDVGAFETAALDLGDAPDANPQVIPTQSYPTLLANNGAAHSINNEAPYLGTTPPDADVDGQPNAAATGDGADEDGLSPTVFPIGETTTVTVTVTNGIEIGNGFGNAWIDFNGDGDWDDAGEQVAIEVDTTPGMFTFDVTIPPGTASGTLFARARVCHRETECITPRGIASSGEVEDYALTIGSGVGGGGGSSGCKSFNLLGWCTGVGAADSWSLVLLGLLGLWRRVSVRRRQ